MPPPRRSGRDRVQSIEDILAVLGRAGFSDDDTADAAFVFNTFVVGFVLEEALATEEPSTNQSDLADQVRRWFNALPSDQFPRLTALADRLFDPDRRFEFGLAVLLDGLESRLHTAYR